MTTRTMLDNARAMKARERIDGAAFGPEALKAIGQAFDEAWLGSQAISATIHKVSRQRARSSPTRCCRLQTKTAATLTR